MLLDSDLNIIYTHVDSTVEAAPVGITLDQTGNIYSAWAQGNQGSQQAMHTALIRKYSIGTVGLEEKWAQNLHLRVFPNPASEFIHVELEVPDAGQYQFSLYDLGGKRIRTMDNIWLMAQKQEVTLVLPRGLTSGMYLLRIEAEGFRASRKVVIR